MDIALPSFILGYHGCDDGVAERVFSGRATLRESNNDYDWLGPGIYFWEHNAKRAYEFACDIVKRPHPSGQKIKKPAVVGAIIDLGYCLNLLDSRFIELVKEAHKDYSRAMEAVGQSLPENTGGKNLPVRKLDCAVIRTLHQVREDQKEDPFDTVRAAFFEGKPLYDNAGFAAQSHIQVCVRDPRCIVGYFRPLDDEGNVATFP